MRRRRVATPGEWQCKTARSGEWAQHFSNASCSKKPLYAGADITARRVSFGALALRVM